MTPKEARDKLAQIRVMVNTDDAGPEGSMGPRWILGQVQEILGGTDAHPRRASSAIWEEMLAEIGRLRREVISRDEQILKLSSAILPTTEPAEKLVAELMAAARQMPTTSRRLQPANPHPSGCHTEAPGSRDCESDGHYSCDTCSRRIAGAAYGKWEQA